jgi:hypothetical protein
MRRRNKVETEFYYEFKKLEPVFEHPEFGRTKQDFEKIIDDHFLEIDAFGRLYNREEAIARVTKLYEDPNYFGIYSWPEGSWGISKLSWFEMTLFNMSRVTYLVTYILKKEDQLTYRSSLWAYRKGSWKIGFHQATPILNLEKNPDDQDD